MPCRRSVCRTLFFSMLSLSAFTFGGGFVIIPLMRKRFVCELAWLDEEELLSAVAIARSSPGAVTVNVAVQVGRRMAGAAGAVCAVAGTLIPPTAWLTFISLCYDSFRASAVANAFLKSMQPAVAAVVLSAGLNMLEPLFKRRRARDWGLLAGSLVLGLLPGVNAAYLLLAGAAFGALAALWEARRHA